MPIAHLKLRTPDGFDFWRTVFSHGWCSLPPFSYNQEDKTLTRTLELRDRSIVVCVLKGGQDSIDLHISSGRILSSAARADIRRQMATCLELDWDLSAFYSFARRYPGFRWIPKSGAGRMLRSPTAFEDAVKIICTTNCTWALTTLMVTNLSKFGGRTEDSSHFTFPSPAALARLTERELREKCKTGYRAPYISELAKRVAGGDIDLEAWRTATTSTEELAAEIGAIKGMGPYAVGNMLRLLCRHDSLALDSWVRAQFSSIHKNGRKVSDKVIERHYERFGEWRGLLFWLEMVRSWHDGKFSL